MKRNRQDEHNKQVIRGIKLQVSEVSLKPLGEPERDNAVTLIQASVCPVDILSLRQTLSSMNFLFR